ncbi:AMP-binding protein [Sphaerisporangium sp. NPDC051017]|uniref:AMP-binding protein n=1 Tax=Sphaerisporangium sp. NPDC051017 TaxID=3154636 RepID=UPI003421ABE3
MMRSGHALPQSRESPRPRAGKEAASGSPVGTPHRSPCRRGVAMQPAIPGRYVELLPDQAPSDLETLPDLVRWAAGAYSEQPAVIGAAALSYGELQAMVDVVATQLLTVGMAPGGVVGVASGRSYLAPALILGIMRSGAVYLPLDPLYPDVLLEAMVQAADVGTVIVDRAAAGRVPTMRACVIEAASLLSRGRCGTSLPAVDLCGGAYGMFTSGSTGAPKGVLLGHAGLGEYARALPGRVGLGAGDRCLGVAPLGFSSSVRQLLLPLAVGATVVVPTDGQVRTPWELADLIQAERVSHLDVTPSFWRAFLDALPESDACRMLAGVRRVLFASESLDVPLANRTRRLAPHARLWNMYGCTETTGIVTAYEVTGSEPEDAAVPIGTALDHVMVSVALADDGPSCAGSGQIVVTGRAVALGPLSRGTTAGSACAVRRLETGDRAEEIAAGLVWHGRGDRVLKVRGIRVTAESVEQQLLAHDQVRRAAVVAATERGLICTVEPAPETREPDPGRLISWLRQRLPGHMVPAEITVTTDWPLLPNGKTDYRQLAARHQTDDRTAGGLDADH